MVKGYKDYVSGLFDVAAPRQP